LGGREVVAGEGIKCDYQPGAVIVHAKPVSLGNRSFAEKAIEADHVTLFKGAIRYHGVGVYHVPESTVTVSGTVQDPTWLAVQVDKLNGDETALVALPVEPVTNGSMWYFPLYTYYLNGSGTAVFDHDWRDDIHMGSPIG